MDSQKKGTLKYICLVGAFFVLAVGLTSYGHSRTENGEDVVVMQSAQGSAEQDVMVEPTSTPTPTPTLAPTPTPTLAPTSAPTITPPTDMAVCPALSVEGTKLVDANGNPVQLRGVSTHGLAWFPEYVNEECFRQLKEEWGANVVRLAMYTAEYGGYCSGGDKEALKALVKKGVEYATELGLYVIIDWHILSDGNPNTYLEEAKAFFGEMATSYADYTNVLYEICNEPNGGTTWSQVKEYAEAVIPVIREKDADGIILVGTPNWCQYVDQTAADPLTGYENIMYTLHFYAATHTDSLRNNAKAALDAGLPLFVSEYGICDASGNGSIDTYQADQWIDLLDAYQVSYVAWNLSNKAETSAFFKSDCGKTSGFVQADLSASGKWVYEMLREKNGSFSAGELQPEEAPTVPAEPTALPTTEPVAPKEPTETPHAIEVPEATVSEGLTYAATVVNSWEQGGDICAQYTFTIINETDAPAEIWSISIPFSQEFSVISSWNGKFQVEGNVLIITPMDYNNHISAGESVSDIGFILQISQK